MLPFKSNKKDTPKNYCTINSSANLKGSDTNDLSDLRKKKAGDSEHGVKII